MSKIGHYATEVISAIVLLTLITLWVPIPMALSVIMALVLVSALIVSFVCMRRHNYGWCGQCWTPLDPEGKVKRRKFPLALVHLSRDLPGVTFAYGMILISSTVLVVVRPEVITETVWSLAMITLIYVLHANVTHQRLAPWCPLCKHGGQEVKTLPKVLV